MKSKNSSFISSDLKRKVTSRRDLHVLKNRHILDNVDILFRFVGILSKQDHVHLPCILISENYLC